LADVRCDAAGTLYSVMPGNAVKLAQTA